VQEEADFTTANICCPTSSKLLIILLVVVVVVVAVTVTVTVAVVVAVTAAVTVTLAAVHFKSLKSHSPRHTVQH